MVEVMKKLIAVIFVLLALSFSCVGCNSGKFDIYESVISDTANDGLGVKIETNFWTGEYFKKNNMPQKSCSVLGNTYTGEYLQSIIDNRNSYTTDTYIDENGSRFGLRSDTGKLVSLNLMNSSFFDTEPYLQDIDNPEEHAIAFSKEIASNYVDDIDKYTQIIEEPITRYKEKNGIQYEITYYVVTYARKLNDYFTSDYISVKITSKGNLASIMMGDIGAFDNTTLNFSPSKVNESISGKISSAYDESQLKSTDIDDQKIVLTPNGDICIYSYINIGLIDNSGVEYKTAIVLLTAVGKK